MANGINWQTIAAAIVGATVGGIGTGGVLTTTNQGLDHSHINEVRDVVIREVTRIDGWIDEVARKQDDVRERLTVVEAKVELEKMIRDIVIRLERLEREEERRP